MSTPTSETVDLLTLDDAGFARLYGERIKPAYDAHEPERLAAVAEFKRRLAIAAGVVVALIAGLWLWLRAAEPILWVTLAGAALAFVWAYWRIHEVKGKVKAASCGALAEAIGVSFQAAGFEPPSKPRFRELNLLPGCHREKYEDLFHGVYKGAAFDLYEGHLEKRSSDSKGRTRWTTVFRGQCVRLAFPRKFLGVTIVRRDAGLFNMFGGGAELQRIRLEDPVFEKAFEVYGTDQVEARYLLHPAFMQRLVELEAALKGKRIRCAFSEGDLLIAIEGGNLFEPGDMFKPLADPLRARRIVDDIAGVLKVMDAVLTAQAARA